jgi:alpha-1,6-mannosyltransferase
VTLRSRATLASSGLVGAVLVLLGGLVSSAVPASSWAASLPLRDSVSGRMLGLAVVVAGLALLAHSWIRLWRAADRGSARLDDVRRIAATWCLPLLVAPPLFSRDGWSYAAQAELTSLGISPYSSGPGVLRGPIVEAVDPRWMSTPAPYGPLPLLGGGLAAEVLEDPWLLVLAHRLLALAGLVALAWALPRLASWAGRDGAAVSALVLPSPVLLAHGVGGLHHDLLMVGLVAVALVAGRDHGWWLGALVGGLAAAVKLPGGLACLGVALMSLPATSGMPARLVRLTQVAAVSASTLLGVNVLAGLGQGWIGAMGVPASVDTPLSVTTLLEDVLPGSRALGVLGALGITCAVALRWRTGSPGGAVRATAVALTATVLLSPVVHAWYALWCLPIVAACRLGRRGQAVVMWLSVALGLSAPLDSSLVVIGFALCM